MTNYKNEVVSLHHKLFNAIRSFNRRRIKILWLVSIFSLLMLFIQIFSLNQLNLAPSLASFAQKSRIERAARLEVDII